LLFPELFNKPVVFAERYQNPVSECFKPNTLKQIPGFSKSRKNPADGLAFLAHQGKLVFDRLIDHEASTSHRKMKTDPGATSTGGRFYPAFPWRPYRCKNEQNQ
jgi:hypothetical protein